MIEAVIGLGGVVVTAITAAVAADERRHQDRIEIAKARRLRNRQPHKLAVDLIAEQRRRSTEGSSTEGASPQASSATPLTTAGALAEWFVRCVEATNDPNDVVTEDNLVSSYRLYCLQHNHPVFTADQANGFTALLDTHMQIIGRPIQDDGYGGGKSIGVKIKG
jgi:hypothetical protein